MKKTDRGYEPTTGYLGHRMSQIDVFHDSDAPGERVTAPSRFGRRVRYDIHEMGELLDSANMNRAQWVAIAEVIAANHDRYDAFVVMHGTDTMAYTASALSFMLQGLDKTVVLTGSQIPLSRTRNDAVDNLLGALLLAGTYSIPEVGIYFSDKLLRGNRASKVDASGFEAFRSGNFPALVHVGVEVDVRWDLVRPPDPGGLQILPITSEHVAALRLFPSLSAEVLERFLQPPIEGLVLETYGAGNAPDNRPRLLQVLKEAVDRGVVIINCTQCFRGMVTDDYSTGRALADVGVVAGADLTAEAALTKLQWLLSRGLTPGEVRHRMTQSLRGELTEPQATPRFRWDG
ncbi:MAG: type I asparaginase [Deltaproteobacteria bacterium]|nr:type I asparaginase [Deltaproteobacteria bacterium]